MSEITQASVFGENTECETMFRGHKTGASRMEHTVNTTTNLVDQTHRLNQTSGGGRRDRTDDLMLAKHALSQLSYAPVPEDECSTQRLKRCCKMRCRDVSAAVSIQRRAKMVGLGRLELPTSRLSSARSNQLSYKP